MMVQALSTSVVICAYSDDRRDQLAAAVKSVEEQMPAPSQIVIVIDHNDGLRRWAEEEWPCHTVVSNDGAPGLSDARNRGVREARADLVAFLDDDAVARPGWMAALTRALGDAAVGGVGGTVLPRWESGRPLWFPEEFFWVVGCSYRGLPTTVSPIRNPIGASMAFRRSLLVEAGAFRTEVGRVGDAPAGCEETELSIRIGDLGFHVLHVPGAVVDHLVPTSRGSVRYFVRRCVAEGRSKAVVAQLVGPSSGLKSERTYVVRTLPSGVIREIAGRGGDRGGVSRAAMILVGLAVTGIGYLQGAVLMRRGERLRSNTRTTPSSAGPAPSSCGTVVIDRNRGRSLRPRGPV